MMYDLVETRNSSRLKYTPLKKYEKAITLVNEGRTDHNDLPRWKRNGSDKGSSK